MKTIKALFIVVILLLLNACGQSSAYLLSPQWHDNVEILLEIRPGKPQVGMNEIMVFATHKERRPAHEYVISIKLKGSEDWRQSIQDGHSGVYRRAIRINDPVNDVLVVQLEKAGEKTQLSFPLTLTN